MSQEKLIVTPIFISHIELKDNTIVFKGSRIDDKIIQDLKVKASLNEDDAENVYVALNIVKK